MKTQKSPSFGQKLVNYGLAAGAASLATSAKADIQYSGPLNFSGNTIYFDLQNTVPPSMTPDPATHDFILSANSTKMKASVGSYGTSAGMVVGETRGAAFPRPYALQLNAGTTIGSGSGFATYGFFNNNYAGGTLPAGEGLGDWTFGERGFVGMSIQINAQTVYGWADVQFNNYDGSGVGSFTLFGYAYEDNGMSIAAGAVPEPSTFALLAAGAAGVAFLKRRKAKA